MLLLRRRFVHKRIATLILLTSLTGCALTQPRAEYSFHRPTFAVTPVVKKCEISVPVGKDQEKKLNADCVVLLAEDFKAVLIELQATCLAAGNKKETCQILKDKP